MKESISNSYIFGIIIVFVGIIIVILVGSLSYSKAFKIKTQLISIIERYRGYDNNNTTLNKEIDEFLKTSGYKVSSVRSVSKCPTVNGVQAMNRTKNYDYCIYRFSTNKGDYYRVTVFISFDVPVISSYLRIPMSGETRIIYDL